MVVLHRRRLESPPYRRQIGEAIHVNERLEIGRVKGNDFSSDGSHSVCRSGNGAICYTFRPPSLGAEQERVLTL